MTKKKIIFLEVMLTTEGVHVGVVPYNAKRDPVERAQAAMDHVTDMVKGRESSFRSFTTDYKTARFFAKGNPQAVIKAQLVKL